MYSIKCRKRFGKYFLLIEYHNLYKNLLKDKKLLIKQTKIDELLDKLDYMLEDNKEIKEKLDEQIEQNKQLQVTLDKNLEKTKEIAEHLHVVSHNQVSELNDDKITHVFILLKKNEYYALRTQQSKVKSVLNKKTDYNVIIRFDNCPNPIELNTLIKEECKDVVTYRNNIIRRRVNVSEKELINRINELYNRRIVIVI